jgi:hypothetical protein
MFSYRKPLAALLVLIAFGPSSCGYALVGRGTALPPDIRSIRIPVFDNASNEPGIENVVTREVKAMFIRDGRLEVVEGTGPDSALTGVIEKYELKPLAFDDRGSVTSYMAELRIMVVHRTPGAGRVLARRRVEFKEIFKVDASMAGSEGQRMAALSRSAAAAAESILSLVVESF